MRNIQQKRPSSHPHLPIWSKRLFPKKATRCRELLKSIQKWLTTFDTFDFFSSGRSLIKRVNKAIHATQEIAGVIVAVRHHAKYHE